MTTSHHLTGNSLRAVIIRHYPYVGAPEFTLNYCITDLARDKFAIKIMNQPTMVTSLHAYVSVNAYDFVYSSINRRPWIHKLTASPSRPNDWVTAWRLRLGNLGLKYFCHDHYQPAEKVPWR